MNATIRKFGYPTSLLREYRSWVVLLRPAQPTLGSLVLACKEDVNSLGAVSSPAYAELAITIVGLEGALQRAFQFDKINYLALMMVDPHVHFHVIPRYAQARDFRGVRCEDVAWPKPPDLSNTLAFAAAQMGALQAKISSAWEQ